MSFDTERVKVGRQPLIVVELDLDFCQESYGVAPCTASGSAGNECYNTRISCQDTPNYNRGTKTYRFCEKRANIPADLSMIACVKSVDIAPTRITPTEGLGYRASVTIKLTDFTHHDRSVDPYALTRLYDPVSQGTYFGKLQARNPYYIGRTLRVRSGFITDPWDWNNFQDREYIIEKIEGPDKRGEVTIVAKDILKMLDGDRAQIPLPSSSVIEDAGGINSSTTSVTVTDDSEYDIVGPHHYIRIGDEIMNVTAKPGGNVLTVVRGTRGTTAEAHDEGEVVQLCYSRFDRNCVNVVEDILTGSNPAGDDYVGMNAGYIPSADWYAERDAWLSSHDLTFIISEPTPVNDVIADIMQQCLFYIWWDEIDKEIKLKAIAPNIEGNAYLSDEQHFLKDSIEITEKIDDRASEVWVYYNKINATEDDRPKNFRNLYVEADLESETDDLYGEKRIRTIYSNYFDESNTGQAITLASRTLARLVNNPKVIKFYLDPKDQDIWTGDVFDADTTKLQNSAGGRNVLPFQVVEVRERRGRYEYLAQAAQIFGRVGLIGPDTLLDYDSESVANKLNYAFIVPLTGTFDDDAKPYSIT